MGNHYHLALRTPDARLSRALQLLHTDRIPIAEEDLEAVFGGSGWRRNYMTQVRG
jgi:hypothetical protein